MAVDTGTETEACQKAQGFCTCWGLEQQYSLGSVVSFVAQHVRVESQDSMCATME
jgi:hypothetical protein